MSPKCAKTRCTGTLEVSGSFPSFDISCNVCGAVHGSYYSRKLAEQELSYIEDDRRDEEQKQADTDAELARLRANLDRVTQELDEARRVMALITDSEFLALNHESHRDSYGESLGRYYTADVVGPNSLVVVEDETLNGCVDKALAVILEAKQAGEAE